MLTSNQTLNKGRYRITNEFDGDGTNSLFEAYDTVSNSNVILREISFNNGKVLTTSQRDSAEATFVGNAKVLTKIRHGNLVAVQDYFSEVGSQYFVLENLAGFDLTEFVKPDRERPGVNQVVDWAIDLLKALEHLHKLSPPIIHGSIHPGNIRFRDEKTPKLLALDVKAVQSSGNNGIDDSNLNYLPLEKCWPSLDQITQRSILRDYDERSERILLHKLDARSDLYSLAACMYYVLTGSSPVSALDRAYAIREGKQDPLVCLSEADPSIPESVSSVFMKALSVRREFRFYSAAVMAENLKDAVANSTSDEEPYNSNQVTFELDDETPLEALPIEIRKEEIAAAIASDENDVRLELEITQAEERQRQLDAEQARLEQEQRRIEERRAELEAQKLRHQAEKEELEQKAKLEHERKENERREIARKRAEAEAIREREQASQRLAEIEAELEQRRLESEKIEKEIEEERLRAVERLEKVREEKERAANEQRKQAEELKLELERAEQRLQSISGAPEPKVATQLKEAKDDAAEAAETALPDLPNEPQAESKPEAAEVAPIRHATVSDLPEISIYSAPDGSPQKRLIFIGAAGVALALIGIVFWYLLAGESGPSQPAVVIPETSVTQPAQDSPASSEPLAATDASGGNSSNGTQESQSGSSVASATDPGTGQQSDTLANPQSASNSSPAKKRAVAPKPQPSKKVTADDLINDN